MYGKIAPSSPEYQERRLKIKTLNSVSEKWGQIISQAELALGFPEGTAAFWSAFMLKFLPDLR